MKKYIGLVTVGWLAVGSWAATVGAGWRIAVPEKDGLGVRAALENAGRVLASALAEGGVTCPVVRAAAPFKDGAAIYIGAGFARAAGIEPKADGLKGFENVIAEKGGSIYLYGNDRPGRSRTASWEECILPSVKAVTDFMETYLDVAFLAPGETGRDVPKFDAKRANVPTGFVRKRAPQQNYGMGRNHEMMYCYANEMYGAGLYHTYGGHTYPEAVASNKYFATHPEYFALKDGKRQPGRFTALCVSNPDVQELIYAELLRRFDAGAEVVELGQHDGGFACQCAKCGGTAQITNNLWRLHLSYARRLLKDRPGKTLQIISYGPTSLTPPGVEKMPPNVMVEMCRYTEKYFDMWKDLDVRQGFTTYIYLWGGYNYLGYTPKRSFRMVADTARLFARRGVRGVYRCGYGELYGTEGAQYWVFNRVLADSARSEEALVEEYCRRAYGPAAEAMLKYYRALDMRLRAANKIEEGYASMEPGDLSILPAHVWAHPHDLYGYVYSFETLPVLRNAIGAAEATKGLTAKQRRRLALARTEFDYAENLARIVACYNAWKVDNSYGNKAEIMKLLDARNRMIDGLYEANGKAKHVPGWPEIAYFGGNARVQVQSNGRLLGVMVDPLEWKVELPGAAQTKTKQGKDAAGKASEEGWK